MDDLAALFKLDISEQDEFTCLQWDRNVEGPDNHLIIAGTVLGHIYVYSVSPSAFAKEPSVSSPDIISPVRKLVAHTATVHQVLFDPFKIVSSSDDGDLKAFDSITGKCIKSFRIRQVRHGNAQGDTGDQIRKSIWMNMHTIIATANDTVKCWSFYQENSGATPQSGKRKMMRHKIHTTRLTPTTNRQNSLSPLSASLRNMPFSQRQQFERDIQDDVEEVKKEQEHERKQQERVRRKYLKYNGIDLESPVYARITEDELVQYAMTLSRGNSEAGSLPNSALVTGSSWSEDDQMAWALRESEESVKEKLPEEEGTSNVVVTEATPERQEAQQGDESDFDWQIQIALKLSMEDH